MIKRVEYANNIKWIKVNKGSGFCRLVYYKYAFFFTQ